MQHGDSVGIGGAFEDRQAAEFCAHRRGKVTLMLGKIMRGQSATALLYGALGSDCRHAEVERIGPLIGDLFQ